ncbi:MAG TPA: cupin domain-containing protein [Steroidobacteraceae bacterium]|nr:cupin domain-containing protein [Steroidobacteraceae bacterium]
MIFNPSRPSVTVALVVVVACGFAAGFSTAQFVQSKQDGPLHWRLDELKWVALPEFGGQEAIIYRSQDGKRVYAAFKESGHESFKYPFDEFGYVTSGTADIKIKGGPAFKLAKGDTFVFREGMEVDLEFGPDFSDLTVLTADHEVKWR